MGQVVEYTPTWVEWTVSLGILALGCFVFTVLAKAAIPIELGQLRARQAVNEPIASVAEHA